MSFVEGIAEHSGVSAVQLGNRDTRRVVCFCGMPLIPLLLLVGNTCNLTSQYCIKIGS